MDTNLTLNTTALSHGILSNNILSWPWESAEKMFNSFTGGNVYVIAAETGRGKSHIATAIARHAVLLGKYVDDWTTELPRKEVIARMFTSRTPGVSLGNLMASKWDLLPPNTEANFVEYYHRFERGAAKRFRIVEDLNPACTSIIDRMKKGDPKSNIKPHLVIVDHLDNVRWDINIRSPRVERMNDGMLAIKAAAEENDTIVIVLQQMNAVGAEDSPIDKIRGSNQARAIATDIYHLHNPKYRLTKEQARLFLDAVKEGTMKRGDIFDRSRVVMDRLKGRNNDSGALGSLNLMWEDGNLVEDIDPWEVRPAKFYEQLVVEDKSTKPDPTVGEEWRNYSPDTPKVKDIFGN